MANASGYDYRLRILDQPEEMASVEELQRQVWTGSETEVVPAHLLLAAVHNGGLVVGAYQVPGPVADEQAENEADLSFSRTIPPDAPLVGFVFGFPGLYFTPDGARPKHCSHMLGVLPDLRDQGIGFILKRAQWQMVRHQGLDCVTWTYDPLLSRNARLNIARLGAVCNTYRRNEYGEMRDGLNAGLASDRFQVDWWINSQRVFRRLSKRARLQLDLAHFLATGAAILNPTEIDASGLPHPPSNPVGLPTPPPQVDPAADTDPAALLLLEIPADFSRLRQVDLSLAQAWREHTRHLFEELFALGYLVTDFVFLPGTHPRSFYVLSHGESTL